MREWLYGGSVIHRLKVGWGMGLVLVALGFWAAYLSNIRIFQVDEAQNLTMTRIAALHLEREFFTAALLWMHGPLAWVCGRASEAASIFEGGRWLFLGVFLLNALLIALNTGERLWSLRGGAALLGASTLAPLWDYGFEIRHDNLLLTGLLLIWWFGRHSGWGRLAFAVMGVLSSLLLFVAFKSFVFLLPLNAVFLVAPPPNHRESRINLGAYWMAGAILGGGLVAAVYMSSGLWPAFIAGLKGGVDASQGASSFSFTMPLLRLPLQIPLVLGLAAAAVGRLIADLIRLRVGALTWGSGAPEAALALGGLFVLYINPTPFPYNLVNLVPFFFLAGFRFSAAWLESAWEPGITRSLVLAVLAFTHVVPFMMATVRHHDWTNDRQVHLIKLAESMTDPAKDRVYDAVGMVPTRASSGFYWYLHSLNLDAFLHGRIPSVSRMLTERPAAILIPNYRLGWLPETEQRFLSERYLPLADDFWVLGARLPAGGGVYHVVHPGRYLFLVNDGGRLVPLSRGTLGGNGIPSEPVALSTGEIEIRTPTSIIPMVAWIGPNLSALPRVGRGDHRRLFVNWY